MAEVTRKDDSDQTKAVLLRTECEFDLADMNNGSQPDVRVEASGQEHR